MTYNDNENGVCKKHNEYIYVLSLKNIGDILVGRFLVYENNNLITELYPEKRIYASNNNMPMTEAGIDPGLSRDLYITLGTLINDDVWSVRIYHKPLIRLIWLGALMMVFGGILSVLYKRKNLAFSR